VGSESKRSNTHGGGMGTGTDPFDGRVQQDVLRIYLRDGTIILGSYLSVAGMHYLHVADGSSMGKVEGPFVPVDVEALQVVAARDQVVADRLERSLGERLPGREPVTATEIRDRLEMIARCAAQAPVYRRRLELQTQFEKLADTVELSKKKRRWMLSEAVWNIRNNTPPERIDLSGGDYIIALKLEKPKDRDFEPDRAVRRARQLIPEHVANDPFSIKNMIVALRHAGFHPRRSVLSGESEDAADLLVDFAGGKFSGRFLIPARRNARCEVIWGSPAWEGGDSKTGIRRRDRAIRTEEYKTMVSVLRTGRKVVLTSRADAESAQDVTLAGMGAP
jgi:hypothetical protein